jgi:hypothetical protein
LPSTRISNCAPIVPDLIFAEPNRVRAALLPWRSTRATALERTSRLVSLHRENNERPRSARAAPYPCADHVERAFDAGRPNCNFHGAHYNHDAAFEAERWTGMTCKPNCLHCKLNDVVIEHVRPLSTIDVSGLAFDMAETLAELILFVGPIERDRVINHTLDHFGRMLVEKEQSAAEAG